MSTKSAGFKLSGGVPEELFDLVRNTLDEGKLCPGNGLQSPKILLNCVEFLFEIARTKVEIQEAINMAWKWAKVEFNEDKDKENAKLKISKKFESWTIKSLTKFLPSGCSVISDFPIRLQDMEEKKKVNFVRVKVPARIDFAGGWTDTPPITYDLDNPRVLNASILVDGKRPISVEVRKLSYIPGIWIQTEDKIMKCFKSKKEIFENARKPCAAGSLICAVLVASGVFESEKRSTDLETIEILKDSCHRKNNVLEDYRSEKSIGIEMTDISNNINHKNNHTFLSSKAIKRPINSELTNNSKKFRHDHNNSNPFKSKKAIEFEVMGVSREFDFGDDETCGLLITSHSDLPHGSGLGTSSILSGAVLAGIWTLFGKQFEDKDLIHAVLKVEQFHTTGGGWQDQVGGLLPGIKLATVASDSSRTKTLKKN